VRDGRRATGEDKGEDGYIRDKGAKSFQWKLERMSNQETEQGKGANDPE
jgi:hypothetical protein